MNKGEEVIGIYWELLNKMVWLNEIKMKESLKDYKPSEVHCISYIKTHADVNVTKMANAFRMTTGAITKLTKKLQDKGLIESYRKPENKKELYFHLTKQGETVYEVHEEIHKEFAKRDKDVLKELSETDFEVMKRFAMQYDQHLDREIEKVCGKKKKKTYDNL